MVPHRRLMHKLHRYGIQTNLLKWMESFLANRRQMVVLGETISEWTRVLGIAGLYSYCYSDMTVKSLLSSKTFKTHLYDINCLITKNWLIRRCISVSSSLSELTTLIKAGSLEEFKCERGERNLGILMNGPVTCEHTSHFMIGNIETLGRLQSRATRIQYCNQTIACTYKRRNS